MFYFDPFGDDSDPNLCALTAGGICGNSASGSGGAGYGALQMFANSLIWIPGGFQYIPSIFFIDENDNVVVQPDGSGGLDINQVGVSSTGYWSLSTTTYQQISQSGQSNTGFGGFSSGNGGSGAPNNGNQRVANQIKTDQNCTAQAQSAMNAQAPVEFQKQDFVDALYGFVGGIFTGGTASAGAAGYVVGLGSMITGRAAWRGTTYGATYGTCMQAAGQSFYGYTPNTY
jgi:hypothetical protein